MIFMQKNELIGDDGSCEGGRYKRSPIPTLAPNISTGFLLLYILVALSPGSVQIDWPTVLRGRGSFGHHKRSLTTGNTQHPMVQLTTGIVISAGVTVSC